MAAERSLVCAVVVLATLGCAGVPSPSGGSSIVVGADAERLAARLPVVPCANAVRPEAVGVWQSAGRDNALIYDGCSVRFVHVLPHDPIVFFGRRTVARAFHVDAQDYGDPFPYFRSRARSDGDWLQSVSIIGLVHVGRWDGERFLLHSERPTAAVTAIDELGTAARALLRVERFVPTEEQLAAERGVPMPPADGCVPDYVARMMDPTTGCPPEPAPVVIE